MKRSWFVICFRRAQSVLWDEYVNSRGFDYELISPQYQSIKSSWNIRYLFRRSRKIDLWSKTTEGDAFLRASMVVWEKTSTFVLMTQPSSTTRRRSVNTWRTQDLDSMWSSDRRHSSFGKIGEFGSDTKRVKMKKRLSSIGPRIHDIR